MQKEENKRLSIGMHAGLVSSWYDIVIQKQKESSYSFTTQGLLD